MTSQGMPPDAYTDAPALHPNLLIGSLQLLVWVFCHPLAWCHHVARVDPTLRPDFTLAELSWAQWRNPALRRFLLMTYCVRSCLTAFPVSVILWALQCTGEHFAFGVTLSVAVALGGGLAGDVAIGVAGGMTGGWVGGVASGVGYGIAGVGGLVGFFAGGVAGIVSLGVAACLGLGMSGSVINSLLSRGVAFSWSYQISVVVIGMLSSIVVYGLGFAIALGVADGAVNSVAFGIAVEVEVAITFGITVGWRTRNWRRGVLLGIAFTGVLIGLIIGGHSLVGAMVSGVTHGMVLGLVAGVSGSILMCSLYTLPYVLAEYIAGPRAAPVAGVLGAGGVYIIYSTMVAQVSLWFSVPIGLGCSIVGMTMMWWRPLVSYPFQEAWNLLLYRADERRAGRLPSCLRWHTVFWDEHQRWRLFGLKDHLILIAERNPAEGQAASAYVTTSRQRWAAQAAQIELEARQLERCVEVTMLRHAHRRLTAEDLVGPASTLLRSFHRISQDVDAALHQESSYNQRLALRGIEDRLDGQVRELTRSNERYARRFYPILLQWRTSIADHLRALTALASVHQEIDSPYIIGVPLTLQQDIFVGRTDVSARIEHLLSDRRHPSLLLYGQRRMGKTSLLNNLGRLLPTTIVPLFVDLQGPASQASDHAGLLYNIARSMGDSARRQRALQLPSLTRQALAPDPFTCFDEWLNGVEQAMEPCTALLALDEFEALDSALGEGRFSTPGVLGMLRHLIQHRRRFKVLLAGSHTLDELQRWASYLINVQVVHMSYLDEAAARQLIEQPVTNFALRYDPDASQRVLALTRGHPFLVQLLCAELVAGKNAQPPAIRRLARLADVEAAVPEALRHGTLFFADIARNQVDAAGLALLRFLAIHGERAVVDRATLGCQFPHALDHTLALLTHRELIEPVEAGYRFQVELIRRWFAAQSERSFFQDDGHET